MGFGLAARKEEQEGGGKNREGEERRAIRKRRITKSWEPEMDAKEGIEGDSARFRRREAPFVSPKLRLH
jgi:hypothetical protein